MGPFTCAGGVVCGGALQTVTWLTETKGLTDTNVAEWLVGDYKSASSGAPVPGSSWVWSPEALLRVLVDIVRTAKLSKPTTRWAQEAVWLAVHDSPLPPPPHTHAAYPPLQRFRYPTRANERPCSCAPTHGRAPTSPSTRQH
jgi:hypothetical protein